ncbi:carboxylating nicotinate-nucleotide diphosphorylase [Clostridium frigidicarnis]|uniref:Probable nicotinate-nucleotide pyrophosphorylase [carboxylating] n=1 Tax=Clostridium frigidicarnis TaxID=84698 RepID=A0A1I1B9N0_9CLOT|nr:carboxylating nicotinate-nucleotide diphosphorylase [Clostridium frigidicarnis]SFB46502.1 nicotinate-nucleotide pyrophosphorylase [carboxylating] [Clostridium frigidicarnis]
MAECLNMLNVDKYILSALEEDINNEDITTCAILQNKVIGQAELIAKEEGTIAGLSIFKRVFQILGNVGIEFYFKDGDFVKKGCIIGKITGDMRNILSGERTALNFLQRMSGIATTTRKYSDKLQDLKAKVLDTRKTTPNMRAFEKYAVKMGGGYNHRFNLSDGVLIKDNHIGAAGSIKEAVERVRKYNSFVRKIEVEVENLNMVKEALEEKVDIIMLDNMSIGEIKEAVSLIREKATIEVSGNVSLDNIRDIGETGVDYISIGALTHSSPILDLSIKNLKQI